MPREWRAGVGHLVVNSIFTELGCEPVQNAIEVESLSDLTDQALLGYFSLAVDTDLACLQTIDAFSSHAADGNAALLPSQECSTSVSLDRCSKSLFHLVDFSFIPEFLQKSNDHWIHRFEGLTPPYNVDLSLRDFLLIDHIPIENLSL